VTGPTGDELLVRRAARHLALQAAGLVAVAMLLLVALVTVVVVRGQQSATDTLLRSTAATADDVGDPPSGTWVVIRRGAQLSSSPGLPRDVGPLLAQQRATSTGLATVRADDGDGYRVVTARRDGLTVQVVADLRPQHQERSRLLKAMVAAAALSLLLAAGLGVLLGRRAVRPLAEALTLQRGFVADASHELRTPLTLLSTRVQLLDRALQRASVAPQLIEDSHGVVGDVSRLGEVVEDLLVAADPRRDDERADVDLRGLVAAAVASAHAHAASAGVTLTAVPTTEPCPAHVNAAALRRAVLALVDNAVDHTPLGGEVQVAVERRPREVVVSVSDTGPGISSEATEGLLRRFHSGGQRAGRAHYGLGLALTNDVANRHGGHLRLAPTAAGGIGTTFELALPIT
jgi:two-component system OmpR family sensor kinase